MSRFDFRSAGPLRSQQVPHDAVYPASVPPTEALPAPAPPTPLPLPERGLRSTLPRAPGDKLNCADLTREAAIEVMHLCGGILAKVIVEKLESLRRPDGPPREDVLAFLCREGFAWRPRNAATEARLTAKGRAKAQSILIHVSAGNY